MAGLPLDLCLLYGVVALAHTRVRLCLLGRTTMTLTARRTLIACFIYLFTQVALGADESRMEVLEGQDVSGKVFKRLGLPNQDYCYEQCLQEDRCKAVRWGFIEGSTAGQCQLLTDEIKFSELREIKTEDGQKIVLIVSLKKSRR